MNREKILESARNSKDKGCEFENRVWALSSLIGPIAAIIVGAVLFLTELTVKKTFNAELICVGMTAAGVQLLYIGIKMRKIHYIIIGSVQILAAVIAFLCFLLQVTA